MSAPLVTRLRETLREIVMVARRYYFTKVWKMDLGEGTSISFSAKLDKTNPSGLHIGKYTTVTFGAAILTHDWVNNCSRDVYIGDNCFIGAHSIILPGVTIGNSCIVAAASVVARNVPDGSLVAGNPARVVERDAFQKEKGLKPSQPIRRLGKPQEVVSLMVYLASEDAGFITGQTYLVNGGMYFH